MNKVKGMLIVLLAAGCVTAIAEKESRPQFGGDRGNKRDEEYRNRREGDERRGGPGEEQNHRPGGPGGPGGGGMIERFINNPEIAEKLGLADEQIEQMRRIAEKMRERQMELMEAMKNSGRRQAECMTAETVNEDKVMAAIEESGKIQTEMAKLKAQELLALQKILTPEQREKVRNMREKMQEKMQEHMRRGEDRGGEGDRERRGGEQFGDRERRGGEESGDRDREQMQRRKEMMEKNKDQIMQRRKEWEKRRKEEEERERDRRAEEEKQIEL